MKRIALSLLCLLLLSPVSDAGWLLGRHRSSCANGRCRLLPRVFPVRVYTPSVRVHVGPAVPFVPAPAPVPLPDVVIPAPVPFGSSDEPMCGGTPE